MQNLAERFYNRIRVVFSATSTHFFFSPTHQPSLEADLSHESYATKQTNQKIYLSTMDLLVPATMKNAAKRDM